MRPALALNLGLRFILELGALAALGWWGSQVGSNTALHVVLAIAAPLAAAVVWGLFVAPKARVKVSEEMRLAIELAVFLAATAALALAWRVWPAIGLGGIAVANSAFVRLLGDVPASDVPGSDVPGSDPGTRPI
jgi:hypothetical protein